MFTEFHRNNTIESLKVLEKMPWGINPDICICELSVADQLTP
jgi:hypothetical protein